MVHTEIFDIRHEELSSIFILIAWEYALRCSADEVSSLFLRGMSVKAGNM